MAPLFSGFLRQISSSCGHYFAACRAAFRAEVDKVVGGFDYRQVVFYDQYRIAEIDETVQYFEELMDVGEVEAGGGLVQDVQGLPGGLAGKFRGEFDSLRLAAR